MGKSPKYYAVARGVEPGIYTAWFGPEGAEVRIRGFPGALYKGFSSLSEAERWLEHPVSAAASGRTSPPTVSSARRSRSAGRDKRQESRLMTTSPESPVCPAGAFPFPASCIPPEKIVVYTDGGCLGNPGPGGYGAVIIAGQARIELAEGFRLTTNNRMELMACIAALGALQPPADVVLHSDSRYVVNGISKGWARKWRTNHWMRTKSGAAENSDLWSKLLDLCDLHRVQFNWVRGHAGQAENERCDALAVAAAKGPDLREDQAYVEGRTRIPG